MITITIRKATTLRRAIPALLALLCLAAAFADEVHLRNGEVVTGTVTVMGDDVKIDLPDGRTMLFPRAEVDKIVKAEPQPAESPIDTHAAKEQGEAAALIDELLKAPPTQVGKVGVKLVALGDVAVEALAEELARTKDSKIVERLAHALARIGTPQAEKALIQATMSNDKFARGAAAEELASVKGPTSTAALIRLVQFDNQDLVRVSALKALAIRQEWMAVPAVSGVLESSTELRKTAVKTLIAISDPAASLYLFDALNSENGTVSTAAWSVFEAIGAPLQAAYAAGFVIGAHQRYDARAQGLVEKLRKDSYPGLIGLLSSTNDKIRGLATIELLAKSDGQLFGLDQTAWYNWASEQQQLKVALVKFTDGRWDAVSALEVLLRDMPPLVPLENRIDSALPYAIPHTDPPEMRAEDMLDLVEKMAMQNGADLSFGITGSKLRVAGQPISFCAVRPGRSAVVSLAYFKDDNDTVTVRRAVMQTLHTLALLLRMPPCPDNEPTCPASPVSSVDGLDKLTPAWSASCKKNLETGLNILRMRMVGDVAHAAQSLLDMAKAADDPDPWRDAARDCERGILVDDALKYWAKYAELEKDATLRQLAQSRMEALRKIKEAQKALKEQLGR